MSNLMSRDYSILVLGIFLVGMALFPLGDIKALDLYI